MARRSLWAIKDDESWKVTTRTSVARYVNSIKARDLKRFVTDRYSKAGDSLSSIPIEKIILQYLDKEKDINIEDIITITIKKL